MIGFGIWGSFIDRSGKLQIVRECSRLFNSLRSSFYQRVFLFLSRECTEE